jgi:hypothetical protein
MKDYIEGKLGGGKVAVLNEKDHLINLILSVVFNVLQVIVAEESCYIAYLLEISMVDVSGALSSTIGTTIVMISLILSVIGVLVMPLGDIVLSIVLNILGILYGGIGWLLALWALPSLIRVYPQGGIICGVSMALSGVSILGCVGSLLLIANDP